MKGGFLGGWTGAFTGLPDVFFFVVQDLWPLWSVLKASFRASLSACAGGKSD